MPVAPFNEVIAIKKRNRYIVAALVVGAILVALGPLAYRQYVQTQRRQSVFDVKLVMGAFSDYNSVYRGSWVPRIYKGVWTLEFINRPPPENSDVNPDDLSGTSWRFFMASFFGKPKSGFDWDGDATDWRADVNTRWREHASLLLCVEPHSTDTSFLAIEGPDTFFETTEQHEPDLIAVIEMYNSGINWIEPRDFEYLSRNIPDETPVSEVIHGREPTSITVGFADYEAWCLDGSMPFGTLKKFFTNAGSKKYDREKELGPYRIKLW